MTTCSKCLITSKVPDVTFDKNGICNYCKVHDALSQAYPMGEAGQEILKNKVEKIKKDGLKLKYDVIVGASGGTDSSYLLYLTKNLGLRPLAVHLDNGWNTEISVVNLRNTLETLDINLKSYIINWEVFKDILRAQLYSNLPWADIPTDLAIISALYKTANEYGVKHIFVGNNFRTEGKQPTEWTYGDYKQLRHIYSLFGNNKKLDSYPTLPISNLLWYSGVKRITMTRPLYFVNYNKKVAKELLKKELKWRDYGGHHHENIFTRYIIGHWLPKKFQIDKRIITLSAYIRNGELSREAAVEELKENPYPLKMVQSDEDYIKKKLNLTNEEFNKIWNSPNKSFKDYPSYYGILNRSRFLLTFIQKYIFGFKPLFLYNPKNYNS